METTTTKVTEGGRIVIPAPMRKALGLEVGDEVTLSLAGSELKIISRVEAVRRAQALVRKRVRKGRSLVAELQEDRRNEAVDE